MHGRHEQKQKQQKKKIQVPKTKIYDTRESNPAPQLGRLMC
jgi:hypothetical protein